MKCSAWGRLVPLLVVVLVLGACSSGGDSAPDGDSDTGTTTTSTASATPGDTAAAEASTTTTAADTDEPAAAPPNAGSATLTVGDQTWTFDNYYCRVGPEQTGNERVSFSSGSIGSPDGVRLQLDASIQDPDLEGRLEGEGTIQSVTLNDIDDFESPSVALEAVSGFVGSPEFLIRVDGNMVSAEAAFDDGTTDEFESIQGTLEATCGG